MRLQVRRNAYVATLVVVGGIVGASTVGAQTLTQVPPPAGSPAPLTVEEDVAPYSTALGAHVLENNWSIGIYNTGLGRYALFANTFGSWNTATGDWALTANTSGGDNTATGASALYSNTEGNLNTATGEGALQGNTWGSYNTATGVTALYHNTTGNHNNATGFQALYSNMTGWTNTATGDGALWSNTTGNNNTAVGFGAGVSAQGSDNIFLGANVYSTAADTNTMRLGRPYDVTDGFGINQTFIAGIYGTALPSGSDFLPVYINAVGQLGTALASSAVNGGQPTGIGLDVLSQQLQDMQTTIADLRAANAALQVRLAELEARVRK
jgi:hypothetical protein